MFRSVMTYLRTVAVYLMTVGFGGLISAIKGKVMNSIVYLKVDRQDCMYPFRLRIPSSDVITYRQIFINQEYDFAVEAQPKVIVDAGANIGLASIYFANKYLEAKIIAIEPEQSNFELLKENVAPYPNIFPIQAALWNKREEINLIDLGLGKWGFMTEMKHPSESLFDNACHKVTAITIDNIMEDFDLKKINILKVDIEGAEREVFSDTRSWLNKVDSIIIELHECMKAGCYRSFYCGSNGFDNEWHQGEKVYLSRGSYLTKHST
ncbi:MAG: FkbM family methyltransferase [Syntrophaceae bacterium]|nr:FkbM family methyltransferase [Syntrophaceae bacterium]